MSIIDSILKLRPDNSTATAIGEALERAVAAEATGRAELQRLEQQRNDLLLDGSADTLSKAELALATAREAGGRVAVVRQQLEQRLAAAIEAEAAAVVETARLAAEAASKAHAAWWLKRRNELEKALNEGTRLRDAGQAAYAAWNSKAIMAGQKFPGLTFEPPQSHADDPGSWPLDLSTMGRLENFTGFADLPHKPAEGDYSHMK